MDNYISTHMFTVHANHLYEISLQISYQKSQVLNDNRRSWKLTMSNILEVLFLARKKAGKLDEGFWLLRVERDVQKSLLLGLEVGIDFSDF